MTGGKNKDIVEEVFGRPIQVDDRVSALFRSIEQPSQVSVETAEDPGPSGNEQLQSAKSVNHESPSRGTNENKGSTPHVRTIAATGLVLFALAFLAGRYLMQDGNASTEIMPEKQYVNHSETPIPPKRLPLPDAQPENTEPEKVQPEPVLASINQTGTALDWQPVINWSRLLSEISATIPKTMHLSVIESTDGSELSLEGGALRADAIHGFIGSLNNNRQVKSAELTETGIDHPDSQDLLTFSIRCSLASDTKTPGRIDGDRNNSMFDKGELFAPNEAERFFGGMFPVSEHAGCSVKSMLISPKDAIFEDEQTNGRVTKKHAVLTLLGGYQNILKAAEKLQNHSHSVWFDSVSIRQDSETGGLECSIGISIYIADGAG